MEIDSLSLTADSILLKNRQNLSEYRSPHDSVILASFNSLDYTPGYSSNYMYM